MDGVGCVYIGLPTEYQMGTCYRGNNDYMRIKSKVSILNLKINNLSRHLLILSLGLCSYLAACRELDPSIKYDAEVGPLILDRGLEGGERIILDPSDMAPSLEMDAVLEESDATQTVSRSLSQALEPSGESCLGPWMCRDGLGCVSGQCGGCLADSDCPKGLICDREITENEERGLCVHCSEDNEDYSCSLGLSCVSGVCLESKLTYYRVDLTADTLAALNRERYQENFKVPCQFRTSEISDLNEEPILGEFHSCTIRVHGGSSRDFRKLSWRLKFDEALPHVAWGDDRITLRAEYNDLSLMRNALGLTLFEQWTTLPTSRWKYVWLNINGEDQGVYLQVEKNHPEMMRRWGRNPEAPRFEADIDIGHTLERGASGLIPLPNHTDYWEAYQRLAGLSYAPIIHLIEDVLGSESRVDWLDLKLTPFVNEVHLESYLRYISVMRLIQNLDSVRKNYVISLQSLGDETPRWEVYPWDLDLSWGCLFNDETGLSICDEIISDVPLNLGETPEGGAPTYPADGFYNMLTERSLSPVSARLYYEDLLCELASPIENNPTMIRLFTYAEALKRYLTPWVSLDESYRGDSLERFLEAVEEIRTYWEARRSFINDSLSCGH